MMKTIILNKFGEILVSRKLAAQIFNEAEKEWFSVNFDFIGVKFVSSSFADELFAKWLVKFGKVFTMSNIVDEFQKNMIKDVMLNRKCLQIC